ncbi:MAG: branched-chain amino acid transport system II carrier protein [Actinomycetaceae bacterium]|nr:branched-chain amino acid transport system II carrier protein [Actinomycetaceae bacterium]
MKTKLSCGETLLVGATLFGMFFGAGNVIFPIHMGQEAGANSWWAALGFILTGVGIPILAVGAIAVSHSTGLFGLARHVGRGWAYFFTCLLYLTIGPFFAIPRTAATSFTSSLPVIPGTSLQLNQLLFSVVFFVIVLFFSLKPSGIMTWIGKIFVPIFLVFLAILMVVALLNPSTPYSSVTPDAVYSSNPFFHGFLDGYNTMDAIAGLAFGIVVVDSIHSLGVRKDTDVAKSALKAGVVTAILMGVIYIGTTFMGAQSLGFTELSEEGGTAFAQVADHYFGRVGAWLLAVTITVACMKTAIGLVISCSEAFVKMFPHALSYRGWVIAFTLFSLVVTNVGLAQLIEYAVPVLMLLYPLGITLIVLGLASHAINFAHSVFVGATAGALIGAIPDFLSRLPFGPDVSAFASAIPLGSLGLGWIVPTIIGALIGTGVAASRSEFRRSSDALNE